MKGGWWVAGSRWLRLLLPLLVALAFSLSAQAQVVRAFTSAYSNNINGNAALIGNTLMTCASSVSDCATRQQNTGYDNSVNSAFVNTDSGAGLTNSSSATLSLPAGSSVLWAGLYWGARVSNSVSDTTKRSIRFKAAGASGYASLSATRFDKTTRSNASPLSGSDDFYQGFVDVTAQVQAGGNGVYWAGGIAARTGSTDGTGNYAGWSLVVAYQNASESFRSLRIYDGFATVASGSPVSISVGGLLTPAVGSFTSYLGAVAYEGDGGITGDSLQLGGTSISDSLNPSSNFFNSSVTRLGSRITAKSPDYLNQLGFDVDYLDTTGRLPNGATSASVTFTSSQDLYFPGALVFAADLFVPNLNADFSKSAVDLNGGDLEAGDTLEYTLSFSNTGLDGATNVVLTDPIPAGTTYVPGSLSIISGSNAGAKTDASGDDQAEYDSANNRVVFRLGSGANANQGGLILPAAAASVRLRVQVGSGSWGQTINNTASLRYNAQTLGTSFEVTATAAANSPVVQRSDLVMLKTGPASAPLGSLVSYTLTVSNNGPNGVSGASIVDNVPAALSGVSWSCTASGTADCDTTSAGTGASGSGNAISLSNAQIAAGAGNSLVISVSGTASTAGNVVNTASVSVPVGYQDPLPTNNSSSVTTTIAGYTVSGLVYQDQQPNSINEPSEGWAGGATVYVNLVQGSSVVQSVQLSPGSGSYAFSGVAPGSYSLVLTDSATSTAPVAPSGWLFINPNPGSLSLSVSSNLGNQNFGLFQGFVIGGNVFRDDGLGGGSPNNALRDGGEPGVGSVLITATAGGNSRSTNTDANGNYLLYIPSSFGSSLTLAHTQAPASGTNLGGGSALLAASFSDPAARSRALSGLVGGQSYSGYNFGLVRPTEWKPDQSGQTTSPGVIVYSHLLRPGTLGSASLSLGSGDFAYQVRRDANCDGDFADAGEGYLPLPLSFSVDSNWPREADGSLKACATEVMVIAPAGRPSGTLDLAQANLVLAWTGNASVSESRLVTDTTSILLPGGLVLSKQVRNVTQGGSFSSSAAGRPGETLEYCIAYRNMGVSPITSVIVTDPVPFFTNYSTGTLLLNSTSLSDAVDADAGEVSSGIVRVRVGTLAAGDNGGVCYRVQVR